MLFVLGLFFGGGGGGFFLIIYKALCVSLRQFATAVRIILVVLCHPPESSELTLIHYHFCMP